MLKFIILLVAIASNILCTGASRIESTTVLSSSSQSITSSNSLSSSTESVLRVDKVLTPENVTVCDNQNEEYNDCLSSEEPTCENIGKSLNRPLQRPCKGGCTCKSGFYKNKIDMCISEEECRRCPGEHEYFSCGGYCDNICGTLNKMNQTHCPIKNIVCDRKCYCESGYARLENNTCVPFDQCPPPPVCRENEIVDTCANALCAKYCSRRVVPDPCPLLEPGTCSVACVCKEGFFINSIGACVPEAQCEGCPKGEMLIHNAPINCDAEYCPTSKSPAQPCGISDSPRQPRCVCLNNLIRDRKTEKCILPHECPPLSLR